MQEEVENKTLTLIVSGTKFTGRLLKAAISKYAAHRRNVKLDKQRRRETPVVHRGRQTVKQLTHQNQGVSSIDFQDKDIRRFDQIARKYGGLCDQKGSDRHPTQVPDFLQGPGH